MSVSMLVTYSDLGLSPATFLTLASNTDLNIDAEDEDLVFSSVLILVYFIYLYGCVIWRRSNSLHRVFPSWLHQLMSTNPINDNS